MSKLWERVSSTRSAYLQTLENETPAGRLRAWRDLMHDRSLDVVGDIDSERLHGSIKGQVFESGALARWTLSRQSVVRTPQMARKLDDEYVFVSIILDGDGGIDLEGRVHRLQSGDFVVVDGTRPFRTFTAADDASRGFLHFRKAALRQRLGTRETLAYGIYNAGPPLQRLASSFLRDLTGLVGLVDPPTISALADQSLDLIALLANERSFGAVEPSTHQSAMLLRLKVDMKANLKNAVYSIEMAAGALGVSTRYINALLAHEGTSFGRRLIDARLESARRQIIDPRHVHRQITEIAYDWGFNNASHFGRVFKEKFGITPREAKASGMYAALGAAA